MDGTRATANSRRVRIAALRAHRNSLQRDSHTYNVHMAHSSVHIRALHRWNERADVR